MPSSFCRNSVKKTLVNVCFQIIYSYKCFLARIKRSVDDILHALLTEVPNFFAPSPQVFIQYQPVIEKKCFFFSKELFFSMSFDENIECSVNKRFEKNSMKVGICFPEKPTIIRKKYYFGKKVHVFSE